MSPELSVIAKYHSYAKGLLPKAKDIHSKIILKFKLL